MLLGSTEKKGSRWREKAWCQGRLRMQVCPHWQNLSVSYEKLGLTKQINKGGVATCFTAGTNKGWLMTQPIVEEFSLQRTPKVPHLSEAAFPIPRRILAETLPHQERPPGCCLLPGSSRELVSKAEILHRRQQ